MLEVKLKYEMKPNTKFRDQNCIFFFKKKIILKKTTCGELIFFPHYIHY